jgi:hypothetical protein
VSSARVHEKMAIAFGEKEEPGLFLELSNPLCQVASILHRGTRSHGINRGQQANQLFKDKIDPLPHKPIRDLIKRVCELQG